LQCTFVCLFGKSQWFGCPYIFWCFCSIICAPVVKLFLTCADPPLSASSRLSHIFILICYVGHLRLSNIFLVWFVLASELRTACWVSPTFQCSLFLRITTLFSWLKSTLLLKNKCFDTHIYMKTQCLQTKWDAALLERKKKFYFTTHIIRNCLISLVVLHKWCHYWPLLTPSTRFWF